MAGFGAKQPSASAYQSLPTQSSASAPHPVEVGANRRPGNYQISWVADSESRLAKETRGALDRWPGFMNKVGTVLINGQQRIERTRDPGRPGAAGYPCQGQRLGANPARLESGHFVCAPVGRLVVPSATGGYTGDIAQLQR